MSRSLIFARRMVAAGLLAGPLLLSLPSAAAAQSASEILDRALKRYEQRASGIDNYTVVQSVNGVSVTVYFEKRMQDGHPVFEPHFVGAPDLPSMPGGDRAQEMRSGDVLARLADRARLKGTESVDGRTVWVLEVDDLSGLDFGGGGFTAETMTLSIDQADYVPLRMAVSGQLSRDGESHPMTMTTRMEDYRDVDGLLYPFRTSVTVEGMMASMSPEDRAKMQEQMEQMQKQLDEMPPEQRAMLEQQMKNMPQMRAMMEQMAAASAGEDFETTVEVQELRVNQGPPSGL